MTACKSNGRWTDASETMTEGANGRTGAPGPVYSARKLVDALAAMPALAARHTALCAAMRAHDFDTVRAMLARHRALSRIAVDGAPRARAEPVIRPRGWSRAAVEPRVRPTAPPSPVPACQ